MTEFVIKTRKRKDYEQFTCRIEEDLLEKVRKIVAENNLPSVNEFINDCLRFSMENLSVMEDTDEEWLCKQWFLTYLPKIKNELEK